MKKCDYGHLDEIEVRREDQKLYTFKEGDFPRLRLQDIETYCHSKGSGRSSSRCRKLPKEAQPYQARHIHARSQENDGILDSVHTSLQDISSGIRMEYLPKNKWSRLDNRRARVMIQAIEKQLFQ
ncbi:hypothetical protein Tco_0962324 [Tanacetum coccineum]